MEEKQEQLKPLTPEQREAEAAYAEEIRERLGNPTPELARQISENIKHHKQPSKGAGLINPKLPIKPK